MRTSSVEQLIISLLNDNSGHLSSAQIYAALRKTLPALNMSTIYRALERLAGAGRVSVSDMGTGSLVYELAIPGRHHHLVCQRCGAEVLLNDETVQTFFQSIQSLSGFTVKTNHLILFGICQNCTSLPE
jgi:Fe2+ or Zn2+ uptake regulation protein